MNLPKQVLVTGSSGFVGARLCRVLRESLGEGRVTGLDRVRGVETDREMEVRELRRSDLFGFDLVYHLAARAGVRQSWGRLPEYVDDNVLATDHLMSLLPAGCRFVAVSSSSVYGSCELPAVETDRLNPESPYAATKAMMESVVRLSDLESAIVRPFTLYGPGQRSGMAFDRMIADAIEGRPVSVFGGGEQVRDFTFIDDFVDGLVRVGEQGCGRAEVWNLGGGSPKRLMDAVEVIRETLWEVRGVEVELDVVETLPIGDATHTAADIAKARDLLAWTPEVGLAEGLRRQVEGRTRS